MKGALEEAFRAHAWGTRRLLEFCRDLSGEQLAAKDSDRTTWSILEVLNHLVCSDGYFLGMLSTGARLDWISSEEDRVGVDILLEHAERLAPLWQDYLATTDDMDRLVLIDDGTFECRAGVLVANALHHGDLHREWVCSMLARSGMEPPDLQPWEYAIEEGRARFIT